jgi:SAM-dependent methyltransferase
MSSEKEDTSLWDQYRCPSGVQGRAVAALMNQHHSELSDWGLKKVEVEPEFVVLDVGCGGGKTVNKLAELAFKGVVFGIDYSRDMVKFSREVNHEFVSQNRVFIFEGSVEKLGFRDGFFDLVTAIETYYFWPNLSSAFREIKRLLKPKGKLLLVNEMIKDGFYEKENKETIAKSHVRLMSLQKIKRILESAGFTNVEIFTKSGSAFNAILAQKP